MKQFVYRELFFAAKTFFLQNKTKQKKDSTLLTKKNKILTHFII